MRRLNIQLVSVINEFLIFFLPKNGTDVRKEQTLQSCRIMRVKKEFNIVGSTFEVNSIS